MERIISNYREKAALQPGSTRKKERLAEVISRLGLKAFMG